MIRYVFIINFLLFPYSLCQDQSNVNYFSFDLMDAKVDSSLDNNIRNNFADDDGSNSIAGKRYIGTVPPTGGDGADGDLWFVRET